jgi:hypothetical protein
MPDTTIVASDLQTGWTLGTQIYESDELMTFGDVWNGTAYVPFVSGDWASYATANAETPPGSGTYVCQFPTSSAPGWYAWRTYRQIGVSPASTDPIVAQSSIAYWWDGTTFGNSPQTNASTAVQAPNEILSQPLGTDRTYAFTLRDEQGAVITDYLGTETLTCKIWSGQDQLVLASPTASWLVPADGTIAVTVSDADIADLDPGLYRMEGTIVSGATTTRFFDGSINLTTSPGATSEPATYCSFADVLLYAPQIQNLQDAGVGLAGMLGERARARTWTNENCLDGYRPNYGRARRYVSADGTTAGPHLRWVTSGPNGATTPTITDLRAALTLGGLRVTEKVKEANAHMAAAIVYLNQPGKENPYHQQGAFHQATAMAMLREAVIEIDTDDPLDGDYDVRIGQDVTWLT